MSTTEMTTFDEINAAIAEAKIEYRTGIFFPMEFTGFGGNFKLADGSKIRFDDIGVGYFSERSKLHDKYAWWTKMFDNDDFAGIAEATKEFEGRELTLAIYKGRVVGVLTKYKPFTHATLLETLQAKDLMKIVNKSRWTLDRCSLRVDLQVAPIKSSNGDNDWYVGLRISNGHSGHFALRYRVIVYNNEGFEYEGQIKQDRARHMGERLDMTIDRLGNAMNDLSELNIETKLREMSIPQCEGILREKVKHMTVRQERVYGLAMNSEPKNALELIMSIGAYASSRGYAGAVAGLTTPLIDAIVK